MYGANFQLDNVFQIWMFTFTTLPQSCFDPQLDDYILNILVVVKKEKL